MELYSELYLKNIFAVKNEEGIGPVRHFFYWVK